MNLKKELSGVAEVAAQIMGEQLKGQQHQIDKNKNNKIDAHDFAILRGEKKAVKKEEVEQVEEASYSAKAARAGKDIGKPGKMFSKIAASAAKKYGSEERGKKVAGAVLAKLRMKEDVDHDITDEEVEEMLTAYEETPKTFSEMMAAYKENGLSFFAEEPTEEQFNKEIKDQIASATGKKKQPGVASPSTQGVKNMPEEVEVIDANLVNGVEEVTIDERTLTEPEAKKKEEVVKSMKKKMPGFKERYGERAKSVMYATATKIAKEKA
ncbi:MAG: hypothetical protein ACO25L_05055 [Candidatus Nanopelagicales bacterium]